MSKGLGGASEARRAFGISSGQTDVDVQRKRCRNLVLKKLSEAAMLRVDSPHQLAFIKPEADRVVGLARPRLPRRLLTGKDDREPIQVGDDTGIDGLVEREKPRLVSEQLAHGDLVFALLRTRASR